MPATANRTVPSTAGDAHTLLTFLENTIEKDKTGLLEYQAQVGEILRSKDHDEGTKLHATSVLADMILDKPEEADPKAVRRMAKFLIHGLEGKKFEKFDPVTVFTKAVASLTGYASHQDVEGDELGILIRVSDECPAHGVPVKKAKALQHALGV